MPAIVHSINMTSPRRSKSFLILSFPLLRGLGRFRALDVADLGIVAILHAMPRLAVRSSEPNIIAATGHVVIALAHSVDAKAQSTRPVCNLVLIGDILNQIERIASVLYHVLAIIDGAACVAYLVAIIANRIAGPAATAIVVALALATVGACELVGGHRLVSCRGFYLRLTKRI